MAVEEGAALGILVGSLSQSRLEDRKAHVPEILQLYEAMRKRRTTTNVQGAIENRHLFQMADERDVQTRNKELLDADFNRHQQRLQMGLRKPTLSKTADGL